MTNRTDSARTESPTDVVRRLRGRARHLRRESNVQPSPLALAYRRRAAELELQAEVLDEKLVRYAPAERADLYVAA
jgi:hypothetical protein